MVQGHRGPETGFSVMGPVCEGLEGQLGWRVYPDGHGNHLGFKLRAWSHGTGVSGSVSGKGGGCVRAGLKPDGRLPL